MRNALLGCILQIAVASFAQQDLVEVKATGYGRTAIEAEKDALRAAVQQAVGMFVDSETLVKNEQVITDKILTYSDGLVSTKEILSAPAKNMEGVYTTQIKAWVSKGKMEEKLKDARVVAVRVEGEDLWAQQVSRIQNAQEGRALLEKLLNEITLDKLLIARIVDDEGRVGAAAVPTTKVNYDDPQKCAVAFNIEIYFNLSDYYTKVAPRLVKLLDQVGKKVNPSLPRNTPESDGQFKFVGFTNYRSSIMRNSHDLCPVVGKDSFEFAVNIGRDKLGVNQRFAVYQLDKDVYAQTLKQFEAKIQRDAHNFKSLPDLKVFLLDKANNVIQQHDLTIRTTLYGPSTSVGRLVPLKGAYECSIAAALFSESGTIWMFSPEFGLVLLSDTILYRFETLISSEDLKNLGEIRMTF